MIHAVLSNPTHPEYGQATIPFPIPTEEYDHVLEVLAPLGIGDALQRDCRVDEFHSAWPILKRLEDTNINLDELDFLAKRLDSFSKSEKAQFQGMMAKGRYTDMTDLTNLTFCCQQATVITDFSDLEAVGRQHYMNVNDGCASVEELEALDGMETALLLISDNKGVVTPYGVVYDNGMELRHHYDGRYFPAYHHQAFEMEIGVCRADAPEDTLCKAWLYLPTSRGQIEHAMLRAGASTYSETRLNVADLIYDGNDLGFVLDEQGQGMPNFMDKFLGALKYEECDTLRFALDISQNLNRYDWTPLRESGGTDQKRTVWQRDAGGVHQEWVRGSGSLRAGPAGAKGLRNGRQRKWLCQQEWGAIPP